MKCSTCGHEIDYSKLKDEYQEFDECADCNLVRILGLVLKENHITELDITMEKIDDSNN